MVSTRGVSVLELLVLMAIIAVVAAVGAWHTFGSVASDARRLASMLVAVRLTAVTVIGGRGQECIDRSWSAYADLTATVSWPPRGLLFTPDGLPRTCDSGGVGNTTILLEHRGQQAAVIVSSLGRVRWELR
jgi:type II secretory pathway pseudopilin PulG